MKLENIISRFENKKILIIGDLMLDKYIWGNVDRISPEAPVPVVKVTRESQNPGGAANVAYNIHCLKGSPLLVGVVGDDASGKELIKILKKKGMDTSGIFIDSSSSTTVKTRLVVEAPHQQIARIDRERKCSISQKLTNRIFEFVKSVESGFNTVLLEDYDKGMLDNGIIKRIIPIFSNKIIATDPKFDHFFEYKNVTLFKPNRNEVERILGVKLNPQNIKSIGHKIRKKLNCKSVLLTLGKDGMFLFESKGETKIPTKAIEVYDETSAGDTAIAGATMALAAGASLKESACIANFAAGIEVGKFGAVPVTYDELLEIVKTTEDI